MPTIKPISDLRNYNTVLKDISIDSPVFLTKNGRGKFVLMDIQEYEKITASLTLLSALSEGESSAKENGTLTIEQVEQALGV